MKSFTEYIEEEDIELIDWYCENFFVDELDEMVCWLNKLGYKQEQVAEIFNTEELFNEFHENYLKSEE